MAKKANLGLMVAAVLVFVAMCDRALAVYCTAGSSQCDEYISDVHVGTIHNTSTGCGSGGYSDYTAMITEMEVGKSYQITVSNSAGYTGDQCGIWINWNQNEDFDFDDADETILVSGGAWDFQGVITVPAGAHLGQTRMRIRITYTGTVSSCGTSQYGEVEDYSVEVVPAGTYEIIHESATMGPYGQGGGWGFDLSSFMGSRFHIDQQIDVSTIGGHLLEHTSGTVFGAIVSLSGPTALPQGSSFNPGEVIGSVVFTLPYASMDFRVPLSATLPPGDYALIFGAGQFGASATSVGLMPYTGQTNLPNASYILWTGSSWANTNPADLPRFVVEGTVNTDTINVSGYVKTEGNIAIPDVLITDTSTGESDLTDSNGYYEITVPAPWNGSLIPSKTNWTFDPDIRGYCCNITNDITDANFTGSYSADPMPTISGYVTDSETVDGVSGVLMEASTGESTITDVDGYYELAVSSPGSLPEPWNGSITPQKTNWGFDPDVSWYWNLTHDITNQNYTATTTGGPAITISGYVTDSETSDGLSGVLIEANTGESYITDGNGYYELTFSSNPWTGSFTASKLCWSFNPAIRGYANMIFDLSNQNFAGTRVCYYGGGFGSAGNPYLIYTPEHMQEIGTHPEHWPYCFKLMNDIDLSDYTGDSFNIIGYYNDLADNEPFSGSFDGNGHKIYNFTYSTAASGHDIGIFGYLSGFNADIKNVSLINPVIDACSSDVVGSLVGWSSNADIVSCSVSGGSVSGNNLVGGLVGQAGFMGYTTLTNCYADTDVSGNSDVGGLLGWVFDATLSICHSSGSVWGTGDVGGLVGENSDQVFNCYSRSAVSGSTNIGGLVGYNNTSLYTAEVLNCYSSGQVSGTSNVGGLVGNDYNGSYTKSFWDSDINPDVNGIGDWNDPNVIGESSANMQTESTFTAAGWDFVDIWTINQDPNYPIHVVSGPLTATISGYVETGSGVAIEGVLMSPTTGASDTTDTNGYYECVVSIAWNGSIRAIKELWSFDPMLRGYNRLITDKSNENFTGTYIANTSPTISGYVKTSEGQGIWGVLISADTGESVTTDSDGYYELTVSAPQPWNGIVTPSKINWEFDPISTVHVNLTDDTANHNYTGTYTAVDDWGNSPSRYRIIDLGIISDIGVPGYNSSGAYAINNIGQVVGYSTTSAGIKWHAFFWEDANDNGQADPNEMQDLGVEWSNTYSTAQGINNTGQVVGSMNLFQLHTQPYVWQDTNHNGRYDSGEIQYLELLPVTSRSYAYDISDNELAVGYCSTFDGTYACLWDILGDTVTNLGTLGGTRSEAYAINNAGMVVGSAYNSSGEEHAFLWLDGNGNGSSDPCEMFDIGTLGGDYSKAYNINRTGQVVGSSKDANDNAHAFFWEDKNSNGQSDPCEMLDIGHLGGNMSRALGINDGDHVVGFSYTIEGDNNSRRAFYWDSTNGIRDLFSLVCNRSGWQYLPAVTSINNRGEIVGQGFTDDNEYHAFLLVPIPSGDLDCNTAVDTYDLAMLCEQWLLPVLSADMAGSDGDGIVDFLDWAVFANAWQSTSEPLSANWNSKCDIAPSGGDGVVDIDELVVFVSQWLQFSAYCADIAPPPDGDGIVNMPDFAAFAENWLEGIE